MGKKLQFMQLPTSGKLQATSALYKASVRKTYSTYLAGSNKPKSSGLKLVA